MSFFFIGDEIRPLDPRHTLLTHSENVRATSGHLPSPTSLHTLLSLYLPCPPLSIFNSKKVFIFLVEGKTNKKSHIVLTVFA